MKRNKFIIILMVAIILINSIIIPEKSYAVAETAIAVAGTKAAAEILVAFVAIMASQGIKFATWNDANRLYKAINEDSIPELGELTPPWMISFGDIEYYMQNGYWEADGPPPNNNIYADIIQGILAGGMAISDLLDIGNKTKAIFDILGKDIGENSYTPEITIIESPNTSSWELNNVPKSVTTIYNENTVIYVNWSHTQRHTFKAGEQMSLSVTLGGNETITKVKTFTSDTTMSISTYNVRYNSGWPGECYVGDGAYSSLRYPIPTNYIPVSPPTTSQPITYYITNNSPIITDTPLPTIPLPQIENLPKEKIEIVIMPDGTKKVIYDGDIDEIVGIITDTYPIEDMYPKPGTPPYELVETDEKTEIKPLIPPTPWPDPDIQPNPELPENEQDVIPWIQVVINWISETNNTIKDIIVPPEEYEPPELDFEPFKNIVILEKFPFSLPWDVKYVISQLVSIDTQAPIFEVDFPIEVSAVNWSQDVKFDIDFNRFTPLANIMRIMLSLIFVIGLIILTRTFIGGA